MTGKTPRILLVEDEFITAMLMEKQLRKIGYEISNHVTTGENAVLSAHSDPPDLILMDILLAGELDGIEAAGKIRDETDIPVLFVTGYEDLAVRERAEKVKPIGYLLKPVMIADIKAIIDRFFGVPTEP